MDAPPPEPQAVETRAELGTLVVSVTDESGLAIPAARVRVVGPGVLGSREVLTDEEGVARLTDLSPGALTVTIEHPAFGQQRRQLTLEAGRSTRLVATLHESECNQVELLLLYALFPDQARRGATAEQALLTSLPWVSLGGTAGILAHPALGTGEPVTPRLFGLPVAEDAVMAVPRGLVDHLETRSIAVFGPAGGEVALEDRWCEPPMGAWTAAGSAEGTLGASTFASGPPVGAHSGLSVGLDTGLVGEAAGLSFSARPGVDGRLWGLAARSPDAWVAGVQGRQPLTRHVDGDLSALVSGTEAGPMARLAVETGFSSRATGDRLLNTRVEAAAGPDQLATLLSAQGDLRLGQLYVAPAARLRLGSDLRPRAEGALGLVSRVGRVETWGAVGQRHEQLDALSPTPVRAREALVGVGTRTRRTMLLAHGRLAHRADTATGDALPGRAELQLNVRSEFSHLQGLSSYTARPVLDGFNSDLPSHEAGLLLAWPPAHRYRLSPTAGLGLRGAWQEGVLTGGGAGRLGLAYHRDVYHVVLAVESPLDPERLGEAWCSLTVQTGR